MADISAESAIPQKTVLLAGKQQYLPIMPDGDNRRYNSKFKI
jgi:hypothetical protein